MSLDELGQQRSLARSPILTLLLVTMTAFGAFEAFAIEDELIPAGATWRFLDDGSDPSGWVTTGFDDSAWAMGPAQLGYAGRHGQATVVGFGPDPDNKFVTTFFRHQFELTSPSIYSNLTLKILRDDGAIVYLNGAEIHRANLPAGPVGFQSTALWNVYNDEEFEFNQVDVDSSLLVAGTNTVAVEIHRHVTSYDLAFDLALVAGDSARVPRVIRGPYLQVATPTSVIVRWRTDILTGGAVRYGKTPGNLVNLSADSAYARDHEIQISGLPVASRTYYSVGTPALPLAGDDANHFVDRPGPPGTTEPVRIWVTGDGGHANFRAQAVRDAYLAEGGGSSTDVWLMLGDNAYLAGTDDQYQVAVFNMYPEILRNTAVWPAMGNHEALTSSSATQTGPYYENFSLPRLAEAGGVSSGTEAYYSFDRANIHFICLDSHGSDRSVGGPMLTWLAADLADTQQQWIIAFWHHPPYSRGSHDSDVGTQSIEMRTNALPILEAGGVDLVLAGHSHSYERSMLIDGHYGFSSSLLPSMIVDSGDGDPLGDGAYEKPLGVATPNAGAVYTVAGTSSGATPVGPLDHPVMVTSLSVLGSVVIDLFDKEMNVRFLSDTGLTLDEFSMTKGPLVEIPAVGSSGLAVLGIVSLAIGMYVLRGRRFSRR